MKNFSLTMFGRQALAFFLAVFLLCGTAHAAAKIHKVEHKAASDGDEVVLNLDAAVQPKVSTIGGPQPRLVLDFEGAEPRGRVGNFAPKSSVVKGVRMGVHREDGLKTRLVLDLNSTQALHNSSVRVDERTNQVIVSVPGGRNAATAGSSAGANLAVASGTPAPASAAASSGLPSSSRVVAAARTSRSTPLLAASGIGPSTASAPVATGRVAETTATERTPAPRQIQRQTQPARQPALQAAQRPTQQPALQPTQQPALQAAQQPTQQPAQQSASLFALVPEAQAAEKPKSRRERQRLARQQQRQRQAERQARAAQQAAAQQAEAQPSAAAASAQQGARPGAAAAAAAGAAAATGAGALINNVAGDPATPTPDPSAPFLHAIEFDPDSPRGELVQFKLNGFYPPTLRSVEAGDTPQVICEFANLAVAPALQGPLKISGRLVKAIRLDKPAGGGKVRVFVELAPGKHYDLQQVFFKEDNFFVLMVNTVKP